MPDAIWDEAARHYDERQLAALVLWIATTNVFNRMNVTTKQPAGVGGDQASRRTSEPRIDRRILGLRQKTHV